MTVLVTGATGTVGANVVREMQARGVQVRAFVRNRARAAEILGSEVDLAVGDFADPASLRAALDGTTDVFLACANVPNQVQLETNAIDAAVDCGARRVVKLSARGAEAGSPLDFWDMQGRIEQYLHAADVAAVVLKPSMFMSSVLAAADSVRAADRLFVPAGDAKVAMIDPRDVAAVAAVALLDEGHDGHVYELTGPEAVTYHDVAEQLSAILGRRVEYVGVPDDAARAGLLDAGMPEWLAGNLVILFGLLRQGAGVQVTDAVRVVTGREPRTLAAFLSDHAAAFGA